MSRADKMNLPACWPRKNQLAAMNANTQQQLRVRSNLNSFSWPSRLTKQQQKVDNG